MSNRLIEFLGFAARIFFQGCWFVVLGSLFIPAIGILIRIINPEVNLQPFLFLHPYVKGASQFLLGKLLAMELFDGR